MVAINIALLNFIVQNFVQLNIKSVVLFHCWDKQFQYAFTQMTAVKLMYTQYVNIDKPGVLENFPHYFKHTHPNLGIFLDLNCKQSIEFLNMSSEDNMFNEHYHWLIYDEESNMTHFRHFFQNANLSVDANLVYAFKDKVAESNRPDELRVILYDVYNNGFYLGGKLNMTLDRAIICNESACQLERYLSELYTRPKYRQRCYLPDVTWRIATICLTCKLDDPKERFMPHLLSINNTAVDGLTRFGYKLFVILNEMLGFNITQRCFNNWTNGDIHGGGIEEVIMKRVEMTSSPFLITKGRLQYLTALLETGLFRCICMFQTPLNTGIQGDTFLKPFDKTVWWIFSGLLIISAILIWCIFYIEHYRMRRSKDDFVPSLLSTFLMAFGHACAQGSNLIPTSVGGRIAFFSLSLITFIMYNYYTSIVVSLLLGDPIKSDIKTLGQLADSSLEMGFDTLPYTISYLNTSKVPEVIRLVQRKITSKPDPHSVWMNAERGVKRVRDEPGYVFAFESATGYQLVERLYKPHQICNLNEILFRPDKNMYTQLHKNSSYKEIMRLKLLRLKETGIYFKHERYWVRTKLKCYPSDYLLNVGLQYTSPLFLMLLCAYILVLLILGIEFGIKRFTDYKQFKREELLVTSIE